MRTEAPSFGLNSVDSSQCVAGEHVQQPWAISWWPHQLCGPDTGCMRSKLLVVFIELQVMLLAMLGRTASTVSHAELCAMLVCGKMQQGGVALQASLAA